MLVNKPLMGWNTWNTFAQKISEQLILETVDRFVALGLPEFGYRYIVIDDCWSEKERDPVTHKLVASREKFPNGMRAVADYVHSKGLKFGMYSCAGVRTCANYPGSFDHEFLDAETFAEFGCDFLKYDCCFKPLTANSPLLYHRMGNALRACGRDIVFAACNGGAENVWHWIRSTGAHMYRSTNDIVDNFVSFTNIAKSQVEKFCYSAPQCFNDMDMLTVGMFGNGYAGSSGCNVVQYKTQFSLWCLMGTPLMLGCDIRKMTPEILKLVTNRELLAINQDPEVRPAFNAEGVPYNMESCSLVLAKLLANGDLAVGFFNFCDHEIGATLMFENIGFPFASGYDLKFKDVFTGEERIYQERLTCRLDACDCAVFRVTPVKRRTV